MKRRELFVLVLVAFAFAGVAAAVDKSDPTGTWKWSYKNENNKNIDVSLKLEYVKGKLTGKIQLPEKKEIEIKDASFKDGEIRFSVKDGPGKSEKYTTKYLGTLDGDKITGVFETTQFGFDWKANRDTSRSQP